MKDFLIIAGTILILVILIDGIRRKRNERYGKIKVSRSLARQSRTVIDDPDEDTTVRELPNGGARVVGKRDPSIPVPSIEKKSKSFSRKQAEPSQSAFFADDERSRSDEDSDQVPILMETLDSQSTEGFSAVRVEPQISNAEPIANEDDNDDYDTKYDDQYDDDEDSDAYVPDEYEDEDDHYYDDLEDDEEEELNEGSVTTLHEGAATAAAAEPEEVIVINVMAGQQGLFNGAELLDVVLKSGLRFGSMDIFHRYSDAKGDGVLLFSMANMVKPGTFDLDAMDTFETPGVSLFMTLPLDADSIKAYELLVQTAYDIATALGGELKDERRSAMTRQTLEHNRERISDYERKRLFRRPNR